MTLKWTMDGQNGNMHETPNQAIYDVTFSQPLVKDDDCLTGKCYCCFLDNNVHRVGGSFSQTCNMICEQSSFMAKVIA